MLQPPQPSFGLIRKTFAVADTWRTLDALTFHRELPMEEGLVRVESEPYPVSRSQFRRAVLNGWLASRICTRAEGEHFEMLIGDQLEARYDGLIQSMTSPGGFGPSLSPASVEGLISRAELAFMAAVRQTIVDSRAGQEIHVVATPKFRHTFRWRNRRYAIAAIRDLIAHFDRIDPDILPVYRSMMHSGSILHWLISAPSKTSRDRRIQVARSYPLLVNALLEIDSRPGTPFTQAVDAGTSWMEVIKTSCPIAAIRLLRGVTLQRGVGSLNQLLGSRILGMAKLATRLPPAFRPVKQTDWRTLSALYALDTAVPVTNDMLRGSSGLADLQINDTTARELIDMARSLFAHVDPSSAQHWLGTKPLNKLLALAERWHRAIVLASVMDPKEDDVHWPGVIPLGAWTHADGMIVELTSASALFEEGREQQHCVAGYVSCCLKGISRIFSIRGRDGRRLSTAEVTIHEGALRVVQHRAALNRPPSKTAKAILNAWCRDVETRPALVNKRWPMLVSPQRPLVVTPDVSAFWRNELPRSMRATIRSPIERARPRPATRVPMDAGEAEEIAW